MKKVSRQVGDWLETKFFNQENGIIFDNQDLSSFNSIQDFIEAKDHPFKTPIIYYEAFPQESGRELLNILYEELSSKLGNRKLRSDLTLAEMIANAGLKMIVIDKCYLQDRETTEQLLKLSTENKISLILVGAEAKLNYSPILSHPTIAQWHQLYVSSGNVSQHHNLKDSHDQCRTYC